MESAYLFFDGVTPVKVARPRTMRPRANAPVLEDLPEPGAFIKLLLEQVTQRADHYRGRPLARRTAACLRTLRAKNAEEAIEQLRARPELGLAALNSVLLGVTSFFRDRAVFEQLRFCVLPTLLTRSDRVRVWSAACSEGQELYSLAMLLAEEGRLIDSELLGTDCRPWAIQEAASGLFRAEEVSRLEPHWRRNFFVEGPVTASIHPELVRATRWKTSDLFTKLEPGPWHLILWRNMAIYLEPFAAEKLWLAFARELAPGGYLIVGKADCPPAGLPLKRVSPCVYQKTSDSS